MPGLFSESAAHFGECSLPAGVVGFIGNRRIGATAGNPAIIGVFAKPGKVAERRLFVANRSYSGPRRRQ